MSRGVNWKLDRFVERTSRLQRTQLLRGNFSVELSYRFSAYEPEANQVQGWLTQPDEDDLAAFLLLFRPFVLQQEPANLRRTCNELERRLTHTGRRDALRASRKDWKKKQRHVGLQFFINDEEITPELALDLYINGWYFHDDDEKRERLEALAVGHGQLLTRYVFLEALRATLPYVFTVAKVAEASLADGSLSS